MVFIFGGALDTGIPTNQKMMEVDTSTHPDHINIWIHIHIHIRIRLLHTHTYAYVHTCIHTSIRIIINDGGVDVGSYGIHIHIQMYINTWMSDESYIYIHTHTNVYIYRFGCWTLPHWDGSWWHSRVLQPLHLWKQASPQVHRHWLRNEELKLDKQMCWLYTGPDFGMRASQASCLARSVLRISTDHIYTCICVFVYIYIYTYTYIYICQYTYTAREREKERVCICVCVCM